MSDEESFLPWSDMSGADYASVAWNAFQLTAYFGVLFWTLRHAWARVRVRAPVDRVMIATAALAAHMCWGLIVQFVIEDTAQLQLAGADNLQIIQSKRFVKCYSAVVDAPAKWFFSQQLLFAVVVLVLWLLVHSVRTETHAGAWKFVVLGELMAISVALPLAITHLRSRRQTALTPYLSLRTIAAFVLALLSTGATPLLSGALFKANLFFLHVVLVLPFTSLFGYGAAAPSTVGANEVKRRGRVALLYALIAGAATMSHMSSTLEVWRTHSGDVLNALAAALVSHPCQTSISLDAALVTLLLLSTCAAMAPRPALVFAAAPVVGAAGTAALFLGLRELDVVVISQPRESRQRTIEEMSNQARVNHDRRGRNRPSA
jgi:hypothetical protein